MASPHATGVAALVVSQYGQRDPRHPEGLRLAPIETAQRVAYTATEHACPEGGVYHYTRILGSGAVRESDSYCEGDADFNGFYGYGIVKRWQRWAGARQPPDPLPVRQSARGRRRSLPGPAPPAARCCLELRMTRRAKIVCTLGPAVASPRRSSSWSGPAWTSPG